MSQNAVLTESATGIGPSRPFPLPGDIVESRYRIESRLGSGGMGHVYAATHITLGRSVALKVLAPELASNPLHTERFLREAKSASAILHPCVVEITDFGHTASGSPFFVMEHLRGENLGQRLRRDGPIPWAQLGPMALQVCGALHAAHRAGVIHRDIKPENLFVIRDTAELKVLDFGVAKVMSATLDSAAGDPAKLTEQGLVIGTVDYLSPEAIRTAAVDARTDLYSLGVTLYQLVSGTPPFVRSSKVEIMMAHLSESPPPLAASVPPSATALILRAMQRDPAARFPSAAAFYEAILKSLPDGPAVQDAVARAKLAVEPTPAVTEPSHLELPITPALSTPASSTMPGEPTAPLTSARRGLRGRAFAASVVALVLVVVAVLMLQGSRSATIDPQHLASFGGLPEVFVGPGVVLGDAEIELGRRLFSDPSLSGAGDISCESCHPLERYGADGRVVAIGHGRQTTGRNAPSIYNAAGHSMLGWSGQALAVEEQAQDPILDPREMNGSEAAIVDVLASRPEYGELFARAFPQDPQPIRLDNVTAALGAFERTLVTPSPWDHYLAGHADALSEQQRRGFNVFVETGCVQCHSGTYVGATQRQKLGLLRPWPNTIDRGRMEDTGQDADWMMFKVASLRNVTQTSPYFHDGSIEELGTAVRMMAHHQLDRTLDDDEVASIIAFLGSLTGELPR